MKKTTAKQAAKKSGPRLRRTAAKSDGGRRERAEEALRRSEENFDRIARTIQDVIYSVDADTREFSYLSPAFETLLGYTIADIQEMGGRQAFMAAVIQGGQFAEQEDTFNQLVSEQVSVPSWEEWWRGKDGRLVCLEDRSVPVYEDGRLVRTQGILRDVTARKQSEATVKENEALLRALFDLSPDAVILIDPHDPSVSWPVVDCNVAACLMNGYSREQLLGKSIDILNLTSGTPAEREAYLAQLRLAPIVKIETHHRHRDGHLFPVEVSTSLLKIGERELVIGIDRDITERTRAAAELRREKEFLEAMNRYSPAAIVVLDVDENIVSCNPAFERLYGYQSEEIFGKNLDALITTPETLGEAHAYTEQALSELAHGYGIRRRKNGELVHVEIFGVPVMVEGVKVSTLAIYHDITELDRARRDAEDANRAKSEFLANMSHEIRTPMNGVIGMLELALDTNLTPEQRDYLQTSLHSAEALLAVLNDILDFSKIEAGRLELEAINFNLRTAVEDVAYTLAKRGQDKGLEMACLIHPDLSSDLRGDPGRLRQILVNLVGNAIKFTHQGEVVIHAEPTHETNTHATIKFSVQDSGIGIPPDRQAAVFDRFTQADGSTTRKYGGTGLGLTISRQLVEAMGGRMGLESQPGVGSTFWFELTLEKQAREKRGVAPLTLAPVNMQQARLLVVDDNQTNRMILTKNVEAVGSRVESVPSGAKALEALRNAHRAGDPFHVVLLDMQMPGMDGEQTARAIKSDPAVNDVKIIILTSMGQRGDAVRLEALGCSGYLLKPVKQQMLYDAVVAVLGHAGENAPKLITRHTLSEQRKFDLRILLAEDNSINQKLAIVLLQKAGYSVDAVETGRAALEKVQTRRYNAVLMDVQMPEMDGLEAAARIREWEQGRGQHIPIIAMTAHAMQGDRERCLAAGMDDYVSKPLEQRAFFNVLERWTSKDQPQAGSAPTLESQDYSAALLDQAAENLLMGDDGLFGETAEPARSEAAVEAANPAPRSDAPPMDYDSALRRFDGDRDFLAEMCSEFIQHLPQRMLDMRAALQAGDMNTLSRQAHNLKGVALNFSADPLAGAAAALEAEGRHDNLVRAPALVASLEAEAVRLNEYVESLAHLKPEGK